MRNFRQIALGLILLSACGKKEFESSLINPADMPVVEAYLTSDSPIQITIKTPDNYEGDSLISSYGLSGLTPQIFINNLLYTFVENDSITGLYQLENSDVNVVAGDSVKLMFDYNGFEITSKTLVPSKPSGMHLSKTELSTARVEESSMPGPGGGGMSRDTVMVYWENDEQSDYIISLEYLEDSLDLINERFEQTATIISTRPTQRDAQELATMMNLPYFGTYRVILYHINAEYTNLFESVGDNSMNITSAKTNIENGLGIFTSMQSDTLLLEVVEE